MRGEWVGLLFGVLMILVGLVQAWRPEDVVRMNRKYTPRWLPQADWSNDLWLLRLGGVVGVLMGLAFVVLNLRMG